MRTWCFAALVAPVFLGVAGAESYREEFERAAAMAKADPEGARERYVRGYELAVRAGDASYAACSGLRACYLLHEGGRSVEAGRLAAEVAESILPIAKPASDSMFLWRVQLLGLVERGLVQEGKIGQAVRANHAVAETLRRKLVSPGDGGTPMTIDEVVGLPHALSAAGWRSLEREADLLHLQGRTVDAVRMLENAVARVADGWPVMDENRRFYGFKLMALHADMLDFLGSSQAAIAAQERLLGRVDDSFDSRVSSLHLRLNLLRNRSQWDGPSEALLAEARPVAEELQKLRPGSGAMRLLAKMELDLKESLEAIETLRRENRADLDLGNLFEAAYSERDLLMARAASGEDGLEGEYVRLLAKARAMGNKRGEPTLYREHGVYLKKRGRPAEAIPLVAEALRLTRSFGWDLHVPSLLWTLLDAQLDAGDVEGARASIAELAAWLAAHPDAPAERRVMALVARANGLARTGETEAAGKLVAMARDTGSGLPEYQTRWIPSDTEAWLAGLGKPAAPDAAAAQPALRVQPLEVVSVAAPGFPVRTHFSVVNPSSRRVGGEWLVSGPGAAADGRGGASLRAGATVETVAIPASVGPGRESVLAVSWEGADAQGAADARVAWCSSGNPAGDAARWSVRRDPAAIRSVVLDASGLEAGMFRHVSLYHELAVPAGEDLAVPFRLRSAAPLRFEYYERRSQRLLAVDADGNGDFTDAGDFCFGGGSGTGAAMVPVVPGERSLTVEIHVFPSGPDSPAPGGAGIEIDAQTLREGGWVTEAVNTLKP